MHQKNNISLAVCVGKWLVSVESILRLSVVKNGILFTKKYIQSQEYIFVEF